SVADEDIGADLEGLDMPEPHLAADGKACPTTAGTGLPDQLAHQAVELAVPDGEAGIDVLERAPAIGLREPVRQPLLEWRVILYGPASMDRGCSARDLHQLNGHRRPAVQV